MTLPLQGETATSSSRVFVCLILEVRLFNEELLVETLPRLVERQRT